MFLMTSLTCHHCGDRWKYVLSEQFIRLGRPVVECRACWSKIATGQKEWAEMNGSSRFAYLLQNALLVLPVLGLFLLGLAIVAGCLLFLMGRSLALILFSLRRTRRRSSVASTPK